MLAQLRQIAREVACRGVALIRILGEATFDHPSQCEWKVWDQGLQRFWLVANHRRKGFSARVA
jgi:hypothetical protein